MLSVIPSIIMYISVYTLSSLLMLLYEKKSNKLFFLLSLLIPSILAGIRNNVGTDYLNYLINFRNLNNSSIIEVISNRYEYEYGFQLLSKLLLVLVGGNPKITFGIIAFLTIFIFFSGHKKLLGKDNIALVYFIYLLMTFTSNLNLVRQGLAMSICFFALYYLFNDKPLKYIVTILIATSIHTSSIISLTFLLIKAPYIFTYLKKNSIVFIMICISLTMISLYLIQGGLDIYVNKFYQYLFYGNEGGELSNLLDIFILSFILIHYKKYLKFESYRNFLKLVPFYLITMLLGFQSVNILRLKGVFSWLPRVYLIKLRDIYIEQNIITLLIIIFYLTLFILNFGYLGSSEVIPFSW